MFNYLSPRKNYEVERNIWNDFFGPSFFSTNSSVMKTDIRETEKEYLLDVELPGFNKEDVKISMEDSYLTIETKKNEEKNNTSTSNYIRKERYSVNASRSWYVGNVDLSQIKANFNNGILTVSVPKEQLPEKDTRNYINID
ncbi:MAG: Hsp20/alpha crystallin family protein [Erysipelotrichaceae bacterium]|nr:Hsp20/alpha crystallin family protein [Erysipelotrichaceae bacterium]